MANIEDTAVPCPYARLIVGKRHCRVLAYHSGAAGIDIIPQQPDLILLKTGFPHPHLPQS